MIDNLTEAIAHAKKVAENVKYNANTFTESDLLDENCRQAKAECLECAAEHEQLAAWLTELQERRDADDWISVKNQLPEEYGNYLVLTDDRDIDVGTFNPRFEDSWSMCDADGFYWAVQKGVRITHWRPLPKKPDESEET